MLGTIAEYVAELGLDVAKNCGERKIEEHKLRADLTTNRAIETLKIPEEFEKVS